MDNLLGFAAHRGGHVQKNLRKLHFHSRRNPARCPVLDSLHPALLGKAKHPRQLCRPPVMGDQFGIGHADITRYV